MRRVGKSMRAIAISVLLLVWLLPQNTQTNRVHAEPATVIVTVTVAIAPVAVYAITLTAAQFSAFVTTLAASLPAAQTPAIPGTGAIPGPGIGATIPAPPISGWGITLGPKSDAAGYLLGNDLESVTSHLDEAELAAKLAELIIEHTKEQDVAIKSISSEYDCQFYYLCKTERRQRNGIEEVWLKWAKDGSETVSYTLIGVSAGLGEALYTATDDRAPHLDLSYQLNPEVVSDDRSELTLAITISGRGGRVGDLPLEVRDRLPRRPLEVAMVVDRSGSMEEDDYRPTRLEAAKMAAETFLHQIQPGDSAALVSFSEYATVDSPLTEDRGSSLEQLDYLYPDGNTAIGDGLDLAVGVLSEGAEESVKAVVLLSDGMSNEGRDPLSAAADARDAGVPVFTVGIGLPGEDFDEATLKGIADTTSGEYLYAPDAEALSRVYERMGGKVINVAGVNASLQFRSTPLFMVESYTTEGFESEQGELFSYHFDQIPVGEERTVYLHGRPSVLLAEGSAPLLRDITLTYQSLGSERERTLSAGPVELRFDGAARERADVRIDGIDFRNTLEEYAGSTVVRLDQDLRVEVLLSRQPREGLVSHAWVSNSSGAISISKEFTDDDDVSHRLEILGGAGRYTLETTIGEEGGPIYDSHKEDFYVVFKPPREFSEFVDATVVAGDFNPVKFKLPETKLHPHDARVVEAAAKLLVGHSLETQEDVASALARSLRTVRDSDGEIIYGLMDYSNELARLEQDHPSDLETLQARIGDCTDMTALYVSMARSLNIPARGVIIWFTLERGDWISVGHQFAEVYADGEWKHADPTWRKYNSPDAYFEYGVSNLTASVETSPGVLVYDPYTTLKYAVGLTSLKTVFLNIGEASPGEDIDLTVSLEVANRSKKEKAEDLRLRVTEVQGDTEGVDIRSNVRLPGSKTLEAGTERSTEVEITVSSEIAQEIIQGDLKTLDILVELKFDAGGEEPIVKEYPVRIMLSRVVR